MPAVYEILIQGHLSSQWNEWFGGLAITNHSNGKATLRGIFRDQAELFGVLDKLRDLNLALVSVNRCDSASISAREASAYYNQTEEPPDQV
jgi:hypothetical protein